MNVHWSIRNDTEHFCLPEHANLRDVAVRFAEHRINTLLGTNRRGQCVGCVSRGDLIRQLADGHSPADPAVWNRQFGRIRLGDDPAKHLQLYGRKLGNVIPVLDASERCVRVFERTDQLALRIAGQTFVPRKHVMTVAEIGNNHNGDIGRARELIAAAAEAGASAVKFQARMLDEVYAGTDESFLRATDYSTAYTVRQLKRFNLSLDVIGELMDLARALGLAAICTPFDPESLRWLLDYQPDAIKIASGDLTNTPLHRRLGEFRGPVLMSTGMNDLDAIRAVAARLRRTAMDCTFLHTNSTYPTPFEDVNIGFLGALREASPSGLVGYSGHERGIHVPLIAASMGAVVVEKHLTLDRRLEGNDHKVSLLPDELGLLCAQLHDLSAANQYAHECWREVSSGEAINAIALEKGVYLRHDMLSGSTPTEHDVRVRSPRIGLSPLEFEQLDDKRLGRDVAAGEALCADDFKVNPRPWSGETSAFGAALGEFGLPVRMRDARTIWREFSPHFVEYHMFATDLELDPNDHAGTFDGLVLRFHAPEQFDDGFVLDLVNPDATVRTRSEARLADCVRWCQAAAALSGHTEQVDVVVNVGGATQHATGATSFNRDSALRRVADVCTHYSARGVRLLPQTMPPFPWHFGGQGYHNLFVDVQDAIDIQTFADVRFCLDLSHSFLGCEQVKADFYTSLMRIKDVVAYCHVSDASPPNGEGMPIGTGVIDFSRVNAILGLSTGERPWIPEIWNGHLNHFSGFRSAVTQLQQTFTHED